MSAALKDQVCGSPQLNDSEELNQTTDDQLFSKGVGLLIGSLYRGGEYRPTLFM
jgi:hypothetical protein